ncbi:MAG: 4Fe-4S dicluster domain-containing protein [Desulfovibrio sp.]|nr:4Fe-4S dicluster domain-containing protein [Desulfovibrio sp.]
MNEHIQILPDKCRACHRCEMACIAAHHGIDMKEAMKRKDEFATSVHVVKTDEFKASTRCHQCEHAPCVNVCPAHALLQEQDGRIIFRHELCLGCHMCEAACPYGAIAFDNTTTRDNQGGNLPRLHAHAKAVRCDLCRDWRSANGKTLTACMEACPVQCLVLVKDDGSIVEAPKPVKKAPEVKATTAANTGQTTQKSVPVADKPLEKPAEKSTAEPEKSSNITVEKKPVEQALLNAGVQSKASEKKRGKR